VGGPALPLLQPVMVVRESSRIIMNEALWLGLVTSASVEVRSADEAIGM
jgi:hypothetical protein